MTLPATALSTTSTRSVIALLGTVALTVFFPFSIRLAHGTADQSPTELPYLPALEGRRETPFHVHGIRHSRSTCTTTETTSPAALAMDVERRSLSRAVVVVAQTAGMFVLTLIGSLYFRETDLAAILRDLRLSPFAATEEDTRIGLYLFLLAFLYSIPLWVQSLWTEWHRDASGMRQPATVSPDSWPRLAVQGLACGAAFAAILVLRSQVSLDFIYFQF